MDYLASNWLLPVGGMLIAIFVGWVLKKAATKQMIEEGHGPFALHAAWKFLLRFVCPLAIGWIIYSIIFSGVTFN
jgi:NSS family neurotransmitter:Na+ symporter